MTFATFHLLRSPLKEKSPGNMRVMPVTFATYQAAESYQDAQPHKTIGKGNTSLQLHL